MSGFFRRNAILAAIEVGGRLPLLFTLGYLASSVGPDVYGDWALVLATVGVVSSVAALGLTSSISRLTPGETPEEAKGYLVYAVRMTSATVAALGLFLFIARE